MKKNVRLETMQMEPETPVKLKRLNALVENLCGIYTRVARRLGVDRSFVSRVARGERRSKAVEGALLAEYERVDKP
jgi:predicted XRE-type DNA-binding protein